jgi:hypothetical protein
LDIAKRPAAFERKVLREKFGGNKVDENWRKCCNKELIKLLGYLDIFSFSRIRLNWTGHVNKMDSKRKVRYLIIIPMEVEKKDDQKQMVEPCTNRY